MDLLEAPSSVLVDSEDSPRRWWAVQTRARQEKSLARELFSETIPYYLPLTPHENLIRGKVRLAYIPVFSGYMFLYASSSEHSQVIRSKRIANILPVAKQEELNSNLRSLSVLIACGAPLTIEKQLAPGRPIRVKRGSLAGLEGLIIRRQGSNRLLVAVTYLQQGVSVEIQDFMVEPIPHLSMAPGRQEHHDRAAV